MGLQDSISTSCASECSPSLTRKKNIIDKYRRARPVYSSSSSSPEVSVEKIANKKLLARECKKLQRNFNKSLDSNVFSSNTSDSSEPQLQNGRHFNFYNLDENTKVSTEGVLHFKNPLVNKKNEVIFYESRGRMEPMDWSLINDDQKTEHERKTINISRTKTDEVITINKCSECKPEANPEFLNFEQNSTTSENTYEVCNNFKSIPMNLPISILQRKIKSRPKDSLPVTPKIREAFKCLQSDVHLLDLIDKPINKSAALSSKESNLHQMPKQFVHNLSGSKDLCEFDSCDSLSTLGVHDLTDGERKESTDQHEDKSFDFENSSSKLRGIDEYDDEMFNFIKSSSKDKLQDNFKYNANSTTSALKAAFPKKEVYPVNTGLVTLSNSESPSPRAQLYFNRIKNIQETNLNYSLDSDDVSLEDSQNNGLISKKSITFNYEIFKNKLKNTSTQYSPVRKEASKIEEKIKQKDSKKEMRTRQFIMSSNNAFTEETNVVEISNIKIFPKTEPLLTAVSTRYFTKPLTKKEEVDTQTKDANVTTNRIAAADILDTYIVDKSTDVNPNSSLCNNESDSSQDLYLSFDNASNNDDAFTVMIKNNEENLIESLNQHATSTNINELQNVASDKSENDGSSIFHSCKYNDTKTSVVIEEIDNSETLENKNSIIPYANAITDNVAPLYKDMIDSDEEFDIVNVDKFPLYASIFNKLMEIKESQKAIATGVLDVDNSEFDNKVQASTKHENNDPAIGFDNSKSTESSLDISDNHYSSIDASASSNIETDDAAGYPNLLFDEKDNIFGNLKIDSSLLDNSILKYYDNESEPKKINMLPNNKVGMSNHMKKITNALNKYRNIVAKPKITEEVKTEEIDKSIQLQPNTISNFKKLPKRLQLLNEIKKRKAQLTNNKY